MTPTTYKEAGVDLDLYQKAMQKLPGLMQRTHAPHANRIMELSGGFAGLFRLNGGDRQYEDPVLVSGSDGVGTKIKVAIMAEVFNTIGIDLVAMCVNDCLCLGAEPLFFLDYLALGKDNPPLIADLVEGVSTGCVQAKSALLGGETAIMPDLYQEGDFDMAGFSVGVVERKQIIDGSSILPGDVVIGLESNGFHSNGFSLIRKVVFEKAGLSVDDEIDELEGTVGDTLLRPTRIYVEPVMDVLKGFSGAIHGMAHITGGGLLENIERILPENCRAKLDKSAWTVPPMFGWLERLGEIPSDEMSRVFNMGVGFAMIVAPEIAEAILAQESLQQECKAHIIGEVVAGETGVEVAG